MTSIRPNKRLGQNFLKDKRALARILEAADLSLQDTVVEIGPGIGTLTRELAKNAKRVIAVEKDQTMIEILRETTKDLKNIQIIHGDILKLNVTELSYPHLNRAKGYKVVANLPYYITSPVIRKFLEAQHKPKLMVLMVQKEVAQRIGAKPPNMSLLAVSVQFYGKPEIVSYVKRTCFWPQPKVDSAILKIVPRHRPTSKLHGRRFPMHSFFALVKAGFKQPRKQLLNNLSKGLDKTREETAVWLKENGISPSQRAETLRLEDWIKLANSLE